MELQKPMVVEKKETANRLNPGNDHTKNSSPAAAWSHVSSNLCRGSESFRDLEMGVPKVNSVDKKLSWLRSQIIGGGDVVFETPFGTRKLTYADHTASGRCLHYIENFIIANVLPFYGNSHTCDSYVGQRTTRMVHEASSYIKKCLGGGDDDAIIFCGSGTTAAIKRLQEVMGLTVPSIIRDKVINCLANEGNRWVVFVGPYEHHSNLLSWRQSLAEVVEIGLNEDGLIDMDALKRQLELYRYTNRPMIGSFSACSNVTGIRSDTREIATLLHQYGAFACFDFAASPYVKIDMRSGEMDGYDGIFLSPHKFLGGPGSPGILVMNKALYQLGSYPPSTCGGGTVDYVNGFNEQDTLYSSDIEERENAGTPQIIQMIRAALAFWVKEYIGYQAIAKQEESHIQRALNRLLPNQNIRVLGNTNSHTKRESILSFLIYSTTNSSHINNREDNLVDEPESRGSGLFMWGETGNKRDKPLHGPFVATLLNDLFGIQARGGCACAGPYGHCLLGIDRTRSLAIREAIKKGYVGAKPGWARVSFPYYMSNEEFEYIVAALEFVAIYGQRFLPLYHFDLRTGNWTFKNKALIKESYDDGIHVLDLASAFQAINMDRERDKTDAEKNDSSSSIVRKYTSYLESAKRIAALLPKFPSQRRLKGDLDVELFPFRV